MNQNAAVKKAHAAYGENQVSTASQKKLIIMLYDGAIKNLNMAREGLDRKDLALVSERLVKTQAILSELMVSLNMEAGGEIARNLYSLYDFMQSQLIEANLKKDAQKVDVVQGMMSELRESWSSI